MSFEKHIIKKILLSSLLSFVSIHADNIVGIWQLDKENATEKIDKVIANKDEATVIKMLINHSWQEIEFNKDGTFKLVAVEDIVPNQVWKKTDNDVYMIENIKTKKFLAKQIVLSKNRKTLLWKNTFDKKGLNLFFTRSSNSKVRMQKEEESTDLANMIFFDKVYRTNMIKTVNIGDVYYYVGFGKDYSLITLTSKYGDLKMSNMQDMKKFIHQKKEYEKKIDDLSLSLREEIDKRIENESILSGYMVSKFNFKNRKIVNLYGFMDIMESYRDDKGVGIKRASVCKEITSINKEHLKCNNGVEYFLYHDNGVQNVTTYDTKEKTDVANFDVAKERLNETKKLDRAFEEAVKEMD